MDVFYDSDWHIHSEASYDADLKVPDLIENAKKERHKAVWYNRSCELSVYGKASGAFA